MPSFPPPGGIAPVRIAYCTKPATLWTCSFCITRYRWQTAVLKVMPSRSATSLLDNPLAISAKTCLSRGVSAAAGSGIGLGSPRPSTASASALTAIEYFASASCSAAAEAWSS